MFRFIVLMVTWFIVTGSTLSVAATDDTDYTIEVANITNSEKGYIVTTMNGDRKYTINDPKFTSLIERIQTGTRVSVVLDSNNPNQIKELKSVSKPSGTKKRLISFFIGFSIIIGLFCLASKGSPNKFIIGADNRYSNSKVQVVLWFSALMTVYLATLGLRVNILGWDYFGGIGIAENLLALSGISALTYGGAKAITVQKVNSAATSAPATPAASSIKEDGIPSIISNLFQNDYSQFDLGDTQMFFFNLLVVAAFLITSFHFLGWLSYERQITLPDIDTTLLSTFGISQGAYLAKKAASDVGKG